MNKRRFGLYISIEYFIPIWHYDFPKMCTSHMKQFDILLEIEVVCSTVLSIFLSKKYICDRDVIVYNLFYKITALFNGMHKSNI